MSKKITKQELNQALVTEIEDKADSVTLATEILSVNQLISALDTKTDTKVDKETGKGLSTNDYTTQEKDKLLGIETGANLTVLSDDVTSTSSVTAATNKAVNTVYELTNQKIDKVAGKDLSTNDYSDADKQSLINLVNEVTAARDNYANLTARLTAIVSSINNIDLSSAVNDAVAQSKVLVDAVDNKIVNHINDYNTTTNIINSRIDDIEGITEISGGTF